GRRHSDNLIPLELPCQRRGFNHIEAAEVIQRHRTAKAVDRRHDSLGDLALIERLRTMRCDQSQRLSLAGVLHDVARLKRTLCRELLQQRVSQWAQLRFARKRILKLIDRLDEVRINGKPALRSAYRWREHFGQ